LQSGADHRWQYGAWALHAWNIILHTHNTHKQCVIVIAFPLQQWLHERASMLLQTYIACLCYDRMFLEALPVYNWRTITRIICWRLFILYRTNKALCLEAVSTSCSQSTYIAMVTLNEIFALVLLLCVNCYAFVWRCCNYWTDSARLAPFGTCRKKNMRNNLNFNFHQHSILIKIFSIIFNILYLSCNKEIHKHVQ
jgi:hypothetical protein